MTKRRARAPWYVGSSTESGGVVPTGTAWEFDTIASCTTAGVPISTTTAYTGMVIDWGDGSLTEVTSVSDYVHTYSTAGQYHISVYYDDWENVELPYSNSSSSVLSPIAEARASIAKVYAIPTVANTSFQYLFYGYTALTEVADDIFANNPQITNFSYSFYNCSSLTGSIPSGLFDNNTAVTTFWRTFFNCSSLTSIPTDLFRYNTAVTDFSHTLAYCTGLTNQTVYIGAENVTISDYFMYTTGSGNTVYVPAGSTTYTTFSNATSVGCTVATY